MSGNQADLLPCERLVGKELAGQKRREKWRVTERIEKKPGATGGNHSVGYRALNEDDVEGFVKATDMNLLKRGSYDSPLRKMADTLNEQQFERAVLDICHGNNMDRVVHALDYGHYETTEGGVRDFVFFIIFEMASGDVRSQADRERRQGLSWTLVALHNLSVAVQQLHRHLLAHNDIKPSNLLEFGQSLQKLADLGRVTSDELIGPWDGVVYSGDVSYAAPEFWYPSVRFPITGGKIAFSVRLASDLYLVGSMGFFFVTGESLTPILIKELRPEHWPINWKGSYEDVLPYVRDALGRSMEYFDCELPTDKNGNFIKEAQELRTAVLQLCEPDPEIRGHPKNILSSGDQYGVRRYVTLFDWLSKSIKVTEKK